MDLREYIVKMRGENSLRHYSKLINVPLKTLAQYETIGYLDNASPTIISNVCKYYNIDPHNLPNYGYRDDDFIDEVINKIGTSITSERDYSIKAFISNFKDVLNLEEDTLKTEFTHSSIKDKDNNTYILYYLATRPYPKGKNTFDQVDFFDYFIMLNDSLQKFTNLEASNFFFLTSSKSLFYAITSKRNNILINSGNLRLKSGAVYSSDIIYSRYTNSIKEKDIVHISGNELFFFSMEGTIHKTQ